MKYVFSTKWIYVFKYFLTETFKQNKYTRIKMRIIIVKKSQKHTLPSKLSIPK